MGLLKTLGLEPPTLVPGSAGGAPAGVAGPGAKPPTQSAGGPAGGDPLDAQLGQELDALRALLDTIHDDAAAAKPRADLAKLEAGRTQALALADAAKRRAALTALIASARKEKAEGKPIAQRAQAVEKRESTRKEVDVTLGQVQALVLSGLLEDSLLHATDAELKKQRAAYTRADKIADPVAGEKALATLKAPATALLDRATAARTLSAWLSDTYEPLAVKARASIDAVASAPAKAVLVKALDKVGVDRKAAVAARDLAKLQGGVLTTLQRIAKVATDVADTRQLDADLARARALVTAMGADATAALTERTAALEATRASSWPAGGTLDALEASATRFAADVKALLTALDAQKAVFDAKQAYLKARAAMQAGLDTAVAIRTGPAAILSVKVGGEFDAAQRAVDTAVAAADWATAKAKLPALQAAARAVVRARDDERAYRAALATIQADLTAARTAMASPAGVPDAAGKGFRAANKVIVESEGTREWAKALAGVPALKTASQAVLKVLADGAKYYTAFATIRAVYDAAVTAVNSGYRNDVQRDNAKLELLGQAFREARADMNAAVQAQDWSKAKDSVATVRSTAVAYTQVQNRYDADRAPFDTEFAKITDLDKATAAASKPGPSLAAKAKVFKEKRLAVNDAVHAAQFAKAIAGLPALQAAITALVEAQTVSKAAKTEFDTALAAVTDYAEATALAAGPPPDLAAKATTFLQADKAVKQAQKIEDWGAGKAAVAVLKSTAEQLVQARAKFNTDISPAQAGALQTRLDGLQPRIAKAAETPVPKYIATLQKGVADRASEAKDQLAAKDYALAQAKLTQLEAALGEVEAAKRNHAAFLAKFNAAKNGEIQAARTLPLKPPGLVQQRNAALTAIQVEIEKLADAGKLDRALARIPAWIVEAKVWGESQDAYATLHSGKKPDVGDMAKLAKQPGGDKVLDALILNMPAGTPQKVYNAGLKARYGFEIKRFKGKNKDTRNTKGLEEIGEDQVDPEVVEIYRLLSKIPSKRIKGKIKELTSFEGAEGGGVYYSDKKIYMYAGRTGDRSGTMENFGGDVGEIVPAGEEVEEDCKPDTSTPDVPSADATLLHEAAHAEDDGAGFMDDKVKKSDKAFGGWAKEDPDSIAKVAAKHFAFDAKYIEKTLKNAKSTPPAELPKRPGGIDEATWRQRAESVQLWCRMIRAANKPWGNGAICKQTQIGSRVYLEAYEDGRWYSYDYGARSQGITGYQFRAPPEWFAELYAAYFGNKLKPNHPAGKWLQQFKPQI